MASGNLGDLWFQLGIKNNSHKALNSMLKDVQRLEGMINSLNLSINKEQDPKRKKEMKEQLSNALNYLHLLQKVNIELNKISGIKNALSKLSMVFTSRFKITYDCKHLWLKIEQFITAHNFINASLNCCI